MLGPREETENNQGYMETEADTEVEACLMVVQA